MLLDLIWIDEIYRHYTGKFVNVLPLIIVHLSGGLGPGLTEKCAHVVGSLLLLCTPSHIDCRKRGAISSKSIENTEGYVLKTLKAKMLKHMLF